MTKKVKDKYIGVRVDEDLRGLIEVYVDSTDMTVGDLMRKALKEYMQNHSLEVTKPEKAGIR